MPTPFDALAAIPNAYEPVPGLITGGQPSEQQLRDFAAAGGKVVLDVRDPMEVRPFDEPALARELGLEYINVPVSPGATSDEKLDRILAAVREHRDKPMLFHCASANRVGGALLPWFILDHPRFGQGKAAARHCPGRRQEGGKRQGRRSGPL